MDQLFQGGFQFDPCWYDTDLLDQSAFVPYISRPRSGIPAEISGSGTNNSSNMNKRMIEFWRRSWQVRIQTQESESDRCHRHMLSERSRRRRERNSYLDLHSRLPPGTKNDKNSIIQMAAGQIQELKRCKEALDTRNHELEAKLASMENGNAGSTKIRLKVANPSSGLDSMLEVLGCLRRMESEIVTIQSKFSDQELLAVIGVETQILNAISSKTARLALDVMQVDAAEMEEAVHTTIQKVERPLRSQFPED